MKLMQIAQIDLKASIDTTTVTWISIVTMLVLILMVIFQVLFIIYGSEIKKIFSSLHLRKMSKKGNLNTLLEFVNDLVSVLVKMSKDKIGAIIVIENKDSLSSYINIGNKIDAPFSPEFVVSIFYNKQSALHDGAMIIRNWRIASLSSYLPVTKKIVKVEYGARHRAALGVCEHFDCFTYVVSETTGNISYVHGSNIKQLSSNPQILVNEIAKEFTNSRLLTANKSFKNVDIVEKIKEYNRFATEKK